MYKNKCRLENDIVLFQNYDGEDTPIGNIADVNIEEGMLNGMFPLEERFESEAEILQRWNALYPDGRPPDVVETVIVQEPVDEEKAAMAEAIIDLETRMTMLEVLVNA